jgi:hypothetical protein
VSRRNGSNGHEVPLESMPLARSICWRPLGDSYYLLAAILGDTRAYFPLFVTQLALQDIEDQRLVANEGVPVVGLLGGTLARSPERGILFPTITRLVPIRSIEAGEAGRKAFEQALHRARTHLKTVGEVVIGWYRARPHVGRRLLSGDERLMNELFGEPWQTTLVFSPDGHGSFFRYKREAERSFAVPFYELMEEGDEVDVASSVLPFVGYEPTSRTAYPDAAPVELEEALRMESEEELGDLGRSFLRQLRKALLGGNEGEKRHRRT